MDYADTLKRNGLTETEYEKKIRIEMARGLLQQAVAGNVPAPKAYMDRVAAFIGETRGFTTLKVTATDLTAPIPTPDEAALKAYYDAHHPDFTAPESKQITYVSLTPEMLSAKVTIDDKTLHDLYDKRKADFVKPEQRLVERLVYPTEEDAKAAKAKLDAGTATFEQLVAERGLQLSDIDMGEVTQDQLGANGAAVFALKDPGVIGPVMTDLGPALLRMNGIIAAQTTTFDQAREQLAADLKVNQARQMISGQVEGINDKLAGGATIEDLAKETDMQIGHIDFTPDSRDGIAAYSEFRQAASTAKAGDFPQIIQLKDGGIAALRLDKVTPAALIPQAQVADKVQADWKDAETAKAITARAETIIGEVKAGKSLGGFGATDVNPPTLRSGFVDGVPKTLLPEVFKLKAPGDMTVVNDTDAAYVVRLDSITPTDPKDADLKTTIGQIRDEAAQSIATDGFEMFAQSLVARTQIALDQSAINAVNAQLH